MVMVPGCLAFQVHWGKKKYCCFARFSMVKSKGSLNILSIFTHTYIHGKVKKTEDKISAVVQILRDKETAFGHWCCSYQE